MFFSCCWRWTPSRSHMLFKFAAFAAFCFLATFHRVWAAIEVCGFCYSWTQFLRSKFYLCKLSFFRLMPQLLKSFFKSGILNVEWTTYAWSNPPLYGCINRKTHTHTHCQKTGIERKSSQYLQWCVNKSTAGWEIRWITYENCNAEDQSTVKESCECWN